MSLYDIIYSYLRRRFPSFRVKSKHNSTLMRAIGRVLEKVGMPDFNSRYTTTIGKTIYGDDVTWETLAHEAVHMIDDDRSPILFKLRYLFPQVLAPLSLGAVGAIWTPWAWLSLIFLFALAPWPAPWRVAAERRGYLMSTICGLLAYGDLARGPAWRAWIREQFVGWSYYKMAWGKGIDQKLNEDQARAEAIVSGGIVDPDYSWVVLLYRAK